jgi:3D (Asp-Asp-Asp) domain-containing protein/cell wall-associated NlpC family hydrolase
MQSHENEHQTKGEHEDGERNHEEASLDHEGGEPAQRMIPDAPAGGATTREVRAADTRGRSLGNFLLTHYTFALESDPKHKGSPKVSAPGLPKDKKYKKSFLGSPYGIKMQGTGLADDGHYIRYQGNGTYAYGVGGAAGAPVAWKTVAVDPRVIKLGTHIEIEAYKGKGTFEAKDTGGAIKGKHIDVFAGAIPISQAYALGTKHSEVFLVNGGGGGGKQEDDDKQGGGKEGGGKAGGGKEGGGKEGGGKTGGGKASGGKDGDHDGYVDAPSLADVRAGRGVIKKGMEGPAVIFVQKHVHAAADGEFGPLTEAAVKKYQGAHHLEVDGVVGPHTMAALDGHKQDGGGKEGGGKGGGKDHDDDVPHANGSDPVAIARKYVTHPPTPSIKLKGKLPHFTAAGGETNDCADFVSSVLETAGRISGHHINVKEFERSLKAQGWKYVSRQNAKAGDVWMNTSRGHTELVATDGATRLIGSNNDRPGHQVVTEVSGYDGIFLHKHFAETDDGGKGDGGKGGKDDDHGGKGGGKGDGGKDDDKGNKGGGNSEAEIRAEVIDKANNHLGARYSWGAQGPSMFDCSGFSWYVLHNDMHLTDKGRTNAEGLSHAPYTTHTNSPEKGDLVFYGGSGNISHVTIALGSGSQTIGASGGGSHTHGQDPNARVKVTDWNRDRRSKSFGSIDKLIQHKLQGKK